MDLQLISFPLCPYVQRAVITLLYKKVPHRVTLVDLTNPPEWFQEKSPTGRVPLLIVDRKTVLFESAVINEYLDEISSPPLSVKDPLRKALERGWVEYGSALLGTMYGMVYQEDAATLENEIQEFFSDLVRVEGVLSPSGPYFRGADLSLVDTAWAPIFARLEATPKLWNHAAWASMPRTRAWAEALLQVPAVKESVAADFKDQYVAYVKKAGGHLV